MLGALPPGPIPRAPWGEYPATDCELLMSSRPRASSSVGTHSPTKSVELRSTMDVAAFKQKDGKIIYKVVVTNSDGAQYLSEQFWKTKEEAYVALRAHLKALGVNDSDIEISQVH